MSNFDVSKGTKQQHIEVMEMLGALFVQTSRVYDCLLVLLPKDDREELSDLHESGRLLGPLPILLETKDASSDNG